MPEGKPMTPVTVHLAGLLNKALRNEMSGTIRACADRPSEVTVGPSSSTARAQVQSATT